MSVLRSRVCVRHSRTCAGGIHASGKRPSASNIRNQRASARSVLAWRFLPRSALVSAASARCTTTPALPKPSYTNSQPVHASNATSTCSPTNCAIHSPTASRSARNRPRKTSPVSVLSASNVICARCTSNPARIATRGLLCSSAVPTASLSHRAEGVPPASGPDPAVHAIFSTIATNSLARLRGLHCRLRAVVRRRALALWSTITVWLSNVLVSAPWYSALEHVARVPPRPRDARPTCASTRGGAPAMVAEVRQTTCSCRSPTPPCSDALPAGQPGRLLMMLQALVSVLTLVLVTAHPSTCSADGDRGMVAL